MVGVSHEFDEFVHFAEGWNCDIFMDSVIATREGGSVFDEGGRTPVTEFEEAIRGVELGVEFGEEVPSKDDGLNESSDHTTINCHVVSIDAEWDVNDPNGENLGTVNCGAAGRKLSIWSVS